MIDKRQRDRVIKLFEDGVKVSKISREVGVSRQSVYNVIRDDLKTDPELIRLEKELKRTKLQKQIEDLKRPRKREDELDTIKRVVDRLISKVQWLWGMCTLLQNIKDFTASQYLQYCVYCGEEMEYYQKEDKNGVKEVGYRCKGCKKTFPYH